MLFSEKNFSEKQETHGGACVDVLCMDLGGEASCVLDVVFDVGAVVVEVEDDVAADGFHGNEATDNVSYALIEEKGAFLA
jgi:hypothetical protein